MIEEENNVHLFCGSCLDKSKKDFQNRFNKYSLEVGGYVKKKFVENGKSEHMWVKIIGLKENIVIGLLDNCPLWISSLNYGDILELGFDEIENYMGVKK